MRRHFIIASLLVSSCTVTPHRPPPPVPMSEATRVQEPTPTPITPPVDESVFKPADAEIEAAMDKFIKTGKAPLIDKSKAGFVRFPYGEGLSQPTVYCRPLAHCDIELEEGEEILNVVSGDIERWKIFYPFLSGPSEHRTSHIMAKPIEDLVDMKTDLTVGTNRRIYHIWLVSRLQGRIVNARFYYPQDLVQQSNIAQEKQHQTRQSVCGIVNLESVDDRYEIEGNTSWRPTWVANDGEHTYLVMPATIRQSDAPVLFIQNPNGDNALVNYRVVGRCYKVDRIFERATLQWGVGRDKQTVTIFRNQG